MYFKFHITSEIFLTLNHDWTQTCKASHYSTSPFGFITTNWNLAYPKPNLWFHPTFSPPVPFLLNAPSFIQLLRTEKVSHNWLLNLYLTVYTLSNKKLLSNTSKNIFRVDVNKTSRESIPEAHPSTETSNNQAQSQPSPDWKGFCLF